MKCWSTMPHNFKMRARNRGFEGFTKEKEGKWNGPFFFINASDTQFGMIESYLEKRPNPKWDKEIVLTRQAIAAVNQMNPKPRFFVVCGDLIDAFPGTSLRKAQEADFKKVFSELSSTVPLVCVCGNHDLGNQPTPESVQSFREVFGDDYFVFWCGGVMGIVINSQFYEDPSLVEDLAKEQDSWLDHQLEEAKSGGYKHVVVFQHIPWFLKEPEEKKEYFNIVYDLRMKMLEKFHKAGVRAIFCGHYHRNSGGFYKNMELIVTSAIGAQLGKDKHGLRVVKVLDDTICHKYYELKDIPQHVPLQ
ncbi:serine/threonine-protein phosphatase CPPED1-like [Ornithodoros turicata]|uniref:serine/threonine-protein phosphatase CPPED1-like n=1 Tax=Ornithodoros turicata TaxID=34597 RepID=UPI00313982DA